MKPKQGLIHDYDLHANFEKSAVGNTCSLCDITPVAYQWSDLSGEAMCINCGCPYQLKWGSKEQDEEGDYPYLNLSSDFLPVAREYWQETGAWVCYGTMLGSQPGVSELIAWLRQHHPEFMRREE